MNIVVFCASANQIDQKYMDCARELGMGIGQRKDHLFYGGTNLGLMKEVATATIDSGGDVTGIIPECIYRKGVAAESLGNLIVVPDMKERKQMLRDYADAFVALPGGWGTFEEISEVITLKHLGQHTKPIVFLNTAGFYDLFFDFCDRSQQLGFISENYSKIYKVVSSPEEVLDYLDHYHPEILKSKY